MAISLSDRASNPWIYAGFEEYVRWALKCMIAHQSRLPFLPPSKPTKPLNTGLFETMSVVNARGRSHASGSHNVVTVKLMTTFSKIALPRPIIVYALRCCVCAWMHLSTACTHDPTVEKECLKFALCGGAHNAADEDRLWPHIYRRTRALVGPLCGAMENVCGSPQGQGLACQVSG